jgi:hypothetical protein
VTAHGFIEGSGSLEDGQEYHLQLCILEEALVGFYSGLVWYLPKSRLLKPIDFPAGKECF